MAIFARSAIFRFRIGKVIFRADESDNLAASGVLGHQSGIVAFIKIGISFCSF